MKKLRAAALLVLFGALLICPAFAATLSAPKLNSIQALDSGVQVTWSKVSNATGYIVYRKNHGSKQWHSLATLSGASKTSCTDSKAWRGKIYDYTVRAVRTSGNTTTKSGYDHSGLTGCARLSAPALKSTAVTSGGIKLTWGKVSYAEGYQVYRKTLGGGWRKLTAVNAAKTTYTDTSVKTDRTYLYTVRAYMSAGGVRVLGKYNSGISERLPSKRVQTRMKSMSLEEKVAQMFFVTPEALISSSDPITSAGSGMNRALASKPVGGVILFSQNLRSTSQTQTLIANMQKYSDIPLFVGVDEEGGAVSRINGKSSFNVPAIGSMYRIGQTRDPENAYEVGTTIAAYLKNLGFNLDFAPVADIWTNPNNTAIGTRSFGTTASLVSDMVSSEVKGLQATGVHATLKHFPGHGDTATDSHSGYAESKKTLSQLRKTEFVPFSAGIDAGVRFVMVGHISVPNVTDTHTPSSLSKYMVTSLLRQELGFDGIITTDAMNMGAITQEYSSSQAAVKAVRAGCDIVLMPENFQSAYNGVLNAVRNGSISQTRIDESVERILAVKLS